MSLNLIYRKYYNLKMVFDREVPHDLTRESFTRILQQWAN